MKLMAIDPGASGGIAWTGSGETTTAVKMPQGMTEQCNMIRGMAALGYTTAIIEKVGTVMPGNGKVGTATFARHCGHLEAACYLCGVSVIQVAPAKWMREVCGELPKDKLARKHAIKERMARRYPTASVTLSTADALGLLTWGLDNART